MWSMLLLMSLSSSRTLPLGTTIIQRCVVKVYSISQNIFNYYHCKHLSTERLIIDSPFGMRRWLTDKPFRHVVCACAQGRVGSTGISTTNTQLAIIDISVKINQQSF